MREYFFWIGAGAILVACWLFLPKDAFYSGDSGVKLIQVENLISKRYADISLDYNGRDIDPDSEISPFLLKPNCYIQDGRNYSIFPVLFPFLSSFFYSAFGYAGLYIIPLLSAFGVLFLVYSISRLFLPRAAAVASMYVALFATPMFFYSLTYWEHMPVVFLVLMAVFMFLNGGKSAAGSGIICGMAVWLRSEIIILFPILFLSGLYFLRRRKDINVFFLASLVPAAALFIFNRLIYGEWFGHAMRNFKLSVSDRAGEILLQKGTNLWRSLVGLNMPQLVPQEDAGWGNSLALIKSNVALETACFASAIFLVFYALLLNRRSRKRKGKKADASGHFNTIHVTFVSAVLCVATGIYLVTCFFDNSPLITVLRSGGVFSFSPFLVIALLLPAIQSQDSDKRREIYWMLVSSASFLVITSLLAPNDGGIRYGARYLLPAIPLLSIVSFVVFHEIQRQRFGRAFRLVFIVLIACSVLIQSRGYQLLFYKKTISSRFTHSLLDNPAERIAMQAWWMIFDAAPAMVSKKVHILRDTRYLARMIESSRALGESHMTIVLTRTDTITENHTLGKFFRSQNVKILRQEDLVSPYDTYFNFTILTLQLQD